MLPTMRRGIRPAVAAIWFSAAAVACDGADARPRFFTSSEWRAAVRCRAIDALRGLSAVADVSQASDSTFAILLGDERKLLVVDAAFQQIRSVGFDKDGPRGILHPVSAVVTDTMIFIADDARSQVRLFTPAGDDAGTIQLPFIPRRLALSAGRLLVTPLVAGGSPAELAFMIVGGRAAGMGGTIARYDDIGVNTLANMTSVAAFADRVVVMHELVVPFGYVFHPGRPRSLNQRFAVPVPADTRARLARMPQAPIDERNVNQLAVVAFATAAAPASKSVYYVTRTGDGGRAPYRKLVVRLDSMLAIASVTPIDVNPQHMIFMQAHGSLIVVDSDGEWFECKM